MSFSYSYKELACIIIKEDCPKKCSWQAGNPGEAIIQFQAKYWKAAAPEKADVSVWV